MIPKHTIHLYAVIMSKHIQMEAPVKPIHATENSYKI